MFVVIVIARPLDLLSNIAEVVMNVDIANTEVTKVIVTRLIPIVNIIKVSVILLMAAFSFSFGFMFTGCSEDRYKAFILNLY